MRSGSKRRCFMAQMLRCAKMKLWGFCGEEKEREYLRYLSRSSTKNEWTWMKMNEDLCKAQKISIKWWWFWPLGSKLSFEPSDQSPVFGALRSV
jgi:hypothetical protein